MKIRDLSPGERLVLDRRRRGESQRAAARRLAVSLYRYRALEDDVEATPRLPHRPVLGALRQHEECFIRRRRAGLSVTELATTMGVTAWWLTQMEHGRVAADRLTAWWRERRAPAAAVAG